MKSKMAGFCLICLIFLTYFILIATIAFHLFVKRFERINDIEILRNDYVTRHVNIVQQPDDFLLSESCNPASYLCQIESC